MTRLASRPMKVPRACRRTRIPDQITQDRSHRRCSSHGPGGAHDSPDLAVQIRAPAITSKVRTTADRQPPNQRPRHLFRLAAARYVTHQASAVTSTRTPVRINPMSTDPPSTASWQLVRHRDMSAIAGAACDNSGKPGLHRNHVPLRSGPPTACQRPLFDQGFLRDRARRKPCGGTSPEAR